MMLIAKLTAGIAAAMLVVPALYENAAVVIEVAMAIQGILG
jgi:hypothetical protein